LESGYRIDWMFKTFRLGFCRSTPNHGELVVVD